MKYFLCFFIIYNTVSFGQCVSDEGNVYSFAYNGTNYEIVKENLNWVNAAACAVERGGYLAEVNNQEEQDTLFYHANNAGIIVANTTAPDGGGASYLWIGGNDLNLEGEWVWDGDNTGGSVQFWQGTASGSPVGGLFNNWGNEPDNFGSGQDALGFAITNWPLGVAGQWNDVDEANTLYYIIEYPNTSGIDDVNKIEPEFKIYPNPGNEQIIVSIPDKELNQDAVLIAIYNIEGQLISSWVPTNNLTSIDISEYKNGAYFLRLNDKEITEFLVQH